MATNFMTAGIALLTAGLAYPALASADAADGAVEDALAPPRCNDGAPATDAPPELAQFDFLVGDYIIASHAWQGDAWSPPRPGIPARWNGYYGLDGLAIIDEWFDRDPGLDPATSRGINVRMYDSEAGEWDMMWIHSGPHQVQDLRARIIDGKLTMWQVYPERKDFRAYFERLGQDSWQRISLVPDEDGGWVPQFKLVATRIAC